MWPALTVAALLGAASVALAGLEGCNKLWGIDILWYDRADGSAGDAGGHAGGDSGGHAGASAGGSEQQCLNGLDDDQNSLTDCQDPACLAAGFWCAPKPAGWYGPGWLFDQADAACPQDAGAVDLYSDAGIEVPDAACDCQCAAEEGKCALRLRCGLDSNCNDTSVIPDKGVSYSCKEYSKDVDASDFYCACNADTDVVDAKCLPLGGTAPPPVIWSQSARLCPQAVEGSCEQGQACEPPAPAAGAKACVWREGADHCPEGYGEEHGYYYGNVGSLQDTRACKPDCQCELKPGGCMLQQGAGNGMKLGADCNHLGLLLQDCGCSPVSIAGPSVAAEAVGAVPDTNKPSTCTPVDAQYAYAGTVQPAAEADLTVCCRP